MFTDFKRNYSRFIFVVHCLIGMIFASDRSPARRLDRVHSNRSALFPFNEFRLPRSSPAPLTAPWLAPLINASAALKNDPSVVASNHLLQIKEREQQQQQQQQQPVLHNVFAKSSNVDGQKGTGVRSRTTAPPLMSGNVSVTSAMNLSVSDFPDLSLSGMLTSNDLEGTGEPYPRLTASSSSLMKEIDDLNLLAKTSNQL